MLMEALTGAGLGAAAAAILWTLAALGLDRINQGLLTSAGLAALVALCLWLDGWLLAAIPAFALAMAALLRLQSALR